MGDVLWRAKGVILLVIGMVIGLVFLRSEPPCVSVQGEAWLPVYPGAVDPCYHRYGPSFDSYEKLASFATADSSAQVLAFYRAQFPHSRVDVGLWRTTIHIRQYTWDSAHPSPGYHPDMAPSPWMHVATLTLTPWPGQTSVSVTNDLVNCDQGQCTDGGPHQTSR